MSEISVGSLCDDTQSWLKWLVAVQHVRKRRSACDAFLAKKTKKKTRLMDIKHCSFSHSSIASSYNNFLISFRSTVIFCLTATARFYNLSPPLGGKSTRD